ncbi:MAG: 23S rRNA (pseudouridine(1915)-N(3))-methyltransferase RlmH [Gammaproteobacteria bacterium]
MRLRVLAIGKRMPDWVAAGWDEYAKRVRHPLKLELLELAHGGGSEAEGARLLAAVQPRDHVIALDVRGNAWDTPQLAQALEDWMQAGNDVAFLVGGADGLSPACLQRAEQRWSLSALTFPHMLVRVLLAEQLYRAWSLQTGHPYHRA